MAKKIITGVVVSDKADKSLTVKVDTSRNHPLYRKRYTVSKKFYIHDPENQAKIGDIIEAEEVVPISKTKKWQLTKVLQQVETTEEKR